MFKKVDSEGYVMKMEGVFLKTLIHGDHTHMTRVKLNKGAIIPIHDHPHEQIGILISGKVEFSVDGDHFLAKAWDCWCIKESIPHSAIALEDSEIIEVFSPIREDYLTDQ